MNERVYRVNQWMNKYSGWINVLNQWMNKYSGWINVLMNKTKWMNGWMNWTGSSGWVRVGLRLGHCMRRGGGGRDALTAFSSPQILDLRYQNLSTYPSSILCTMHCIWYKTQGLEVVVYIIILHQEWKLYKLYVIHECIIHSMYI